MVKVLQVTGSLRVGGLETVAMNCMRYADKDKFQFDFLVFGDQIGEYEEEAIRSGARIIRIPSPRKSYAQYYRNLCKAIKENGPYDIVHSHVFFNSGIVMLAAKQCGVPLRIAHAHSARRKSDCGMQKEVFRCVMRHLLIKNATRLCACSQSAGDYVFTKRAFRKRGMVLPNVIDTDAFAFSGEARARVRKELGIEARSTVLGQVGHLTAAKNQMFLLDVFAAYQKEHPDSVLLLVGDGELRGQLEQKIETLGLQRNVRLTGTRLDIGDLLSAIDVYVCTSTNEGFGITLLEAAANGLRVVVEERVLVEELKQMTLYQTVFGFEISEWVRCISAMVNKGRSSSIENSCYSIKRMPQYIVALYER